MKALFLKIISPLALLLSLPVMAQIPCTGSLINISQSATTQPKIKVVFKMTRNDEYFMAARAQVEELNLVVAVNVANLTSEGRIISKVNNSEVISASSGSLLGGLIHTVQNEEYFLKIACQK